MACPSCRPWTRRAQFKPEVTPWAGVFVKDADPAIQAELAGRGLLYRSGTYEHTYPFCWRCDSPLLYWAKETWYIRTSAYRDRLVALNQEINWYPEHIKTGRFGNWLENNVDWALGRDRYWGTPLPIWRSDAPGSAYSECIGSVAELEEKVGRPLEDLDLHRPYVDGLTWAAPDGGVMRRVTEVADCWFDSGSMPVAQWHYPFENQEEWERQKQADYICEAIDQTRGWFYTLHAVSTLLFDRTGVQERDLAGPHPGRRRQQDEQVAGQRGQPVGGLRHARRRRHTLEHVHGQPARQQPPLQREPGRRDRAQVPEHAVEHLQLLRDLRQSQRMVAGGRRGRVRRDQTLLDRWVLSELNTLVRDVTEAMENYDVLGATRPVADVRGQPEQLVCAPEPPTLLGRRPRGAADTAYGVGDVEQAARPDDALRRRRDLPEPGGLERQSGGSRQRAPQPLAGL